MNESEQMITRYLLGELTEAEATALEEKYFRDSAVFDQLTRIENDLIDNYARRRMPAALRQSFEQVYLAHPKRRARLKLGEALVARLDREESPKAIVAPARESWLTLMIAGFRNRPALAFLTALAVALIITAGVWLGISTSPLRREPNEAQTARAAQEQREREQRQIADERARADQLASELGRQQAEQRPTPSRPNQVKPAVASLVLTINGVRGVETGAPAKLVVPAGEKSARFQLNLRDSEYRSYVAVLQTADGKQIFEGSGLRVRSKTHPSLVFEVPAKRLSAGDYILTLKGVTSSGEAEDVSKSLFRVERK